MSVAIWCLLIVAMGLLGYSSGRRDEAARKAATKLKPDVLAVLARARRDAPTYYQHLQMRAAHDAVKALAAAGKQAEAVLSLRAWTRNTEEHLEALTALRAALARMGGDT